MVSYADVHGQHSDVQNANECKTYQCTTHVKHAQHANVLQNWFSACKIVYMTPHL